MDKTGKAANDEDDHIKHWYFLVITLHPPRHNIINNTSWKHTHFYTFSYGSACALLLFIYHPFFFCYSLLFFPVPNDDIHCHFTWTSCSFLCAPIMMIFFLFGLLLPMHAVIRWHASILFCSVCTPFCSHLFTAFIFSIFLRLPATGNPLSVSFSSESGCLYKHIFTVICVQHSIWKLMKAFSAPIAPKNCTLFVVTFRKTYRFIPSFTQRNFSKLPFPRWGSHFFLYTFFLECERTHVYVA